MNRTDLIEEVYQRLPQYYKSRYNRTAIKRILLITFDVIMETTSIGDELRVIGFARISTYKKASHQVWCGITKEFKEARQHIKLRIKPSKVWRNMLQRISED